MPRVTDPFRKHVQMLLNKRWKCNFCGNQYAGGATRIKAHFAGIGGYGINDCKDVDSGVRSKARKALKGKGVVESSNRLDSLPMPFLKPDDISFLGLNVEEREPNTKVPQDARTSDGPLESLPLCSGMVVDKSMPNLLTKLEELSSREADMANLETWWRKVKRIKGEYWSVVQAFREGRPLSTSQLSRAEELSEEVKEILIHDRFREELKTLAGCSIRVRAANIPPPSVADFNQEHLRNLIETTFPRGCIYAIFWDSKCDNYIPTSLYPKKNYIPTSAALSSSLLVPVLRFGDGYYKGEDNKPNKVKISTSSAAEQEHRKRVLHELSLLIGESKDNIYKEAIDEEVTDMEWFFLISMTHSFGNGHGPPSQAFLSSTPIWLSGADGLTGCGCERAKQGLHVGLQTMVCIPTGGGVVELGSSELVSSDQISGLIFHIKKIVSSNLDG